MEKLLLLFGKRFVAVLLNVENMCAFEWLTPGAELSRLIRAAGNVVTTFWFLWIVLSIVKL